MTPLRTLLAILSMLVFATSARAQFAEFSVIAGGQSVYGTAPQTLDFPFSGGSYNSSGRGRAASDRGVVRAHTWLENDYTCVCTPQLDQYARAIVDLTTINITGPPGPVSGTLHLVFEGRLDWAGEYPWFTSAAIGVLSGMFGYYTGEIAHTGFGLQTTGLLAGSGAIVDTTYDFPFTIEPGAWDLLLLLETSGGGTSFGSGFNMGLADFYTDRNGDGIGGLHFPTNGPAITLPEGYAANSTDLNIVNSYWQPPTVAVADPGSSPQQLSLRLGANPVRPGTDVRYALPRAGVVRVDVLDVQGRTVATLEDGWRAAGEHRVSWPSGGAPGVYFVRAMFEGRSVTRKAAVLN